MTQTLMLLIALLLHTKCTLAQPADLSGMGPPNDVQVGAVYSFPSEAGRTPQPNDLLFAFINYTYTQKSGTVVSFAEEKAKFGEGNDNPVNGTLVHVTNIENLSDHTACSHNIRGTLGEALPKRDWIALIQRGDCKFDEKVGNVYRHGAIGAIIYDSRDTASLDKMKIDDKSRNITSVFTFKYIGEKMANIVDVEKVELNVFITRGKLIKQTNINRTSVLFVSISFIVLMIISFVWLVFYYVQRFRYLQTKDRKSRQLCTVAKRVIAKIPTKSIKSDEMNDSEHDCCAICIEPYKATDVIRVLPCKHEFHRICIDPWLLEHRTCPMCKMDILKHYGFVFTGSQESILQLDMDVEDGAENNDTNHDNVVALSVSPTFIIQLDADHVSRRHSVESTGSAAREFNLYHQYRQHLQAQTDANSCGTERRDILAQKHHNPIVEASNYASDLLAPTEQRQRAVSLPCTLLRKKNSDSSCHGSNNCYVWALEIQQMAKRSNDSGATSSIMNKCLSNSEKHRKDDSESLLLNEQTQDESGGFAEQTPEHRADPKEASPDEP